MATINGTPGNDVLIGDDVDSSGAGGGDTIYGGGGDDVIDGRSGNNFLSGDDGDDVFEFSISSHQVGPNHTIASGGSGFDTLDFGQSNDYLEITQDDQSSAADAIAVKDAAATAHDQLLGFYEAVGIEKIQLGSGHSLVQLSTYQYDLSIVTGSGGAEITTGFGNDTVMGGSGGDLVHYWFGDDHISLGSGNDALEITYADTRSGDHIVADGGDGIDTLTIRFSALTRGAASVDLMTGAATFNGVALDLSHFENVTANSLAGGSTLLGSDGSDKLVIGDTDQGSFVIFGPVLPLGSLLDGRGGDDQLSGGKLDDTIFGGVGNNSISGGDGNDWLSGGGRHANDPFATSAISSGNDTIDGGLGNDHIWGNAQLSEQGSVDGNDLINCGDGSDYANGNAGADIVHGGSGTDRLYGGAGDDALYGDTGTDHLNGNKGNDTLDGGDGDDGLFGGQDGDQLLGGAGSDTLSGDAGNDTLHGGTGADFLVGGADVDVFAFSGTDGNFDSYGNVDTVEDFTNGVDKVSLGFIPAAILQGSASGTFWDAELTAQQLIGDHPGDHEVAAIQFGPDTLLFFSSSGTDDIHSAARFIGLATTIFNSHDFV
ncbi:MAG TPA: calcium-binding protein [Sphingomonas sp.]|uniref:calcium-binding protein n=1 Tax=Sphingomonas sp. TaxID=28214 RepID=UPI002C0096FA|nr:calcium-binding protein [Sphingomonas sp.]HMI21107.1 calcium-binding protein [Sphingomonas sp.]